MSGPLWMVFGFFGFVVCLIVGAGYALVLRPAAAEQNRSGQIPPVPFVPAGEPQAMKDRAAQLLQRVGEAVPSGHTESGVLRKRLISAGYRAPSAVQVFVGIQCASALLVALTLGWTAGSLLDSLYRGFVFAIAGGYFGYTLPEKILRSRIKSRRNRIRRGLPDALDLMVLSVEAGQSLDQAVIDSSQELRSASPDLSTELALVHLQLRAGKSRAEALQNLSERCGDPDVRQLVRLLTQADRFGTSLGPALRTHSRYLRLRRKQKAEEAARKLSIKLLFPVFFLIFPCMLAVTAGPAILQIVFELMPVLNGNGP